MRADVDAAFNEAGRDYCGPGLRSALFDAALYQAREAPMVTATGVVN